MADLKCVRCTKEIKEVIKDYPSLLPYYNMIAEYLGCAIKDLVWLTTLDEQDEEGWDIESFFPKGATIETATWYEDYHTSDFAIGFVNKITVNGVKYVGECNASPWMIYAKKTKDIKYE